MATEPVDVLDVMDDMLKVMSAQVTLRPSGHQFAVEGHESLLQVGMRAGLKLNYGCGNGSCGMCKVRVTDGQVVRTMLRDSAIPIAIGTMLGVGGAFFATRVIKSFLFDTAPTDPLTLGAVAMIIAATGSIAALVPAMRAARIDPASSLRAD